MSPQSIGKIGFRIVALLGMIALPVVPGTSVADEARSDFRVMGWVENVRLFPGGLKIAAKLDTGARTSSIGVSELKTIWRGGRRWLRFRVSSRHGKGLTLERPVVRVARVRRSQTKTVERPVVMMGLCIGNSYREVEVNLAVRSHLNYVMLIGRTSMRGIVIDPGKKFVMNPACNVPAGMEGKR